MKAKLSVGTAFAVAIAAALYATAGTAALYKWTDAQGRVVYSDQGRRGITVPRPH